MPGERKDNNPPRSRVFFVLCVFSFFLPASGLLFPLFRSFALRWLPSTRRIAQALVLLLLLATDLFAAVKVKDIRLWQGPESSRLVFDLSNGVDYRLFFLSNPERILIDLPGVEIAATAPTSFKPPLAGIRRGTPNARTTRMVVELTTPSKVSSFLLKPQQQYGHRLVVDIAPEAGVVTPVAPIVEENRDVLIAIDAGHGGDDYGTVASGVHEKTLVLDYAKALAREINARTGMRALLIREGDYFISLHKRMLKARRHRADFFLSLHANSFPQDKRVNGFMLFALSDKGASSEVARWLASSENSSNQRGGVDSVLESEPGDSDLRKVILDLSMTSVQNLSILSGRKLLKSVGEVTHLHKQEVESANFAVLRAPDVPALLLELGFLSSPKEAEKLNDNTFRQRMITALANGIESFFYDYPPYGTRLAKIRANHLDNPDVFYLVKKGETLSEIALTQKIPEARLRLINGLKSDKILAGQRLRLREDPQPSLDKLAGLPHEYRVKPGDSLWTIASRFGLSVAQLRSLNKLEKQFIQPGQKLLLYK